MGRVGGQDRVSVRRPLRKHKDVGSNPAVTRKTKIVHWEDPCTECRREVWEGTHLK